MKRDSEVFVALDTAKKRHAVAIADSERHGEIRYFGEIDSSPAAVQRLIKNLSDRYGTLQFCYEAGRSAMDCTDKFGNSVTTASSLRLG